MTPELYNCNFLKAARREPTDTRPVWLMRQAGRYMSEYMEVRSRVSFLELCKTPELAAEVTITAQRVLGVDAAILFADLLPILEPIGFQLEYRKDEGPAILNPVREAADLDRVQPIADMSVMDFVFETVRLVRGELPANVPLLGFAGAPFTLASYAIEGGGSKNFIHTKRLMYSDPGAWRALMELLVATLGEYLRAQIDAGCQAVQIFDSWAGVLSPVDYRRYALPYLTALIASLPDETPVINFLTGNPALAPLQAEAGGGVIGLDWRCDLAAVWDQIGPGFAVQGNLDPILLFADERTLLDRVGALLESVAGRPGYIFNLGHGVLPGTPVENVKRLVEFVHEFGTR